MDSSGVLMFVIGIALGAYFNEPITSAVPALKRESTAELKEVSA